MARQDKFARLRAARAGGKVEVDVDEPQNVDIYDEVDELEFRKHKRDQLLNDDFIVDEQGEGYAETGADDWDNPEEYPEDEVVDDEPKRHKKVKKVKKKAEIASYFKPTTVPKKKPVKTADLDDILSDFTTTATKKIKQESSIFGTKRDIFSSVKSTKSSPFQRTPHVKPLNMKRMMDETESKESKRTKLSSEIDVSTDSFDDAPSSPIRTRIEAHDIKPAAKSGPIDIDDLDDFDDDDDDDEIIVGPRRATANVDRSVNLSGSKKQQQTSSPKREAALPSSPSRFADSSFDRMNESDIIVKDESGSSTVKMFWMDFAEVDNTLLLFGKVKTPDGRVVSGMVQVKGLNREIYFLPREKRQTGEDEEKDDEEQEDEEEEDSTVTPTDVYEEIVPLLMEKYGLSEIKAKPETKKYAFELPNVPAETEYLKVLLPFQTPKCRNTVIPADLEGETFSHVFSANANIFESFVLQRNIMGPCWLDITNADFTSIRGSSHCNVEVSVSSASDITTSAEQEESPTLNLLAINVQSFMNMKSGVQEVGSVSIALYKDLPQDAPIEGNLKPTDTMTLVRPVGGSLALPPGLTQLGAKSSIPIRTFNNERSLLNCLSAVVKKADPDVFVGHKLENVTLDIIVHRMHDLNISTWSNFGRRARKQFPDKFGRRSGRNNIFYLREILQGRLVCDIGNELGQSLTPKCQSWELPEMYEIYCKQKYTPMEVNLANPAFADDSNRLFAALKENAMAVKMISEVAFDIQILSLSKQLTNIAGNAWSHTLGGTRAGRNEYILLHEFSRNNYIVPDKETRQQRRQNAHESTDNGAEDTGARGKAKYQGGLVFEPVKGLVQNYVTVMDFNSLYPSIIQEFNICFTTIDRSNLAEDELPKVPNGDVPQGVLPKLLHGLVSRRREVKKLLKDPRISTMEKVQYDIKQRALKLTANSMYGCLGYVYSRFYAKPLAMLVTNRGREILMDTRQLAESLGVRVVYGDTDSVMVDTGCPTMGEALKFAREFQGKVNDRYKLLEIGIDNVFKKMLLHAKKKYAAINATIDQDGNEVTTLEVKGLDMKRREFCPLSKDVSTFILNKILGDMDTEDALSDIYTYLEGVSSKLKSNEIPMTKLKINTRLSKDPDQYPGGNTMPAVQVAKRLREQGKIIKAGSVMTFVITDENLDSGASVADRARAIQEVLPKSAKYRVDCNYYLDKQLLAPITRLLENVDGYDVVRLAASLGLDSKRYEARARTMNSQGPLQPLESMVADSERFRDSKDFCINCPSCHAHIKFGGIQASKEYNVTFSGLKCKNCDTTIPCLSISAQLEHFIRHEISYYYEGWLSCSECGLQTRQVSVYGRRCITRQGTVHLCTGTMKYCYSDKQLYNQLLYLQSLFDVDKAKKRALKPLYVSAASDKENVPAQMNQGELDALVEQSRPLFDSFGTVVNKYLDDCGRRYVEMGSIFGFMRA